ncbi:hypothetical protein FOL46_008474 [Perkinsus olseni]|uniref:RING-type domain-containing protein n=1 Tax=Perkinsus olseni TaxID=32597 RepID=A0A7J6L6T4_PEROL|nr:hypothetical protein FOL46_008474 [Perkinsus olseni]
MRSSIAVKLPELENPRILSALRARECDIGTTIFGGIFVHQAWRIWRVPPELMDHVEDFVCRECVRAAFPDLDNPQREGSDADLRMDDAPPPMTAEELQRRDRLSAMRRAKSQTFKIKRMTSTFFRVRSGEDAIPVGKSKATLDIDDLANDEDDGTCKVCFEDPATIVLLPCGHGGLCQGCAKDLVLSGKSCYICGKEFHMLAELKAKSSGVADDDADDTTGKGRFIVGANVTTWMFEWGPEGAGKRECVPIGVYYSFHDCSASGRDISAEYIRGLSLVCECALALNRVMEASTVQREADLNSEDARDRNRVKSIQYELDALRLALVGNLSLVHLRLGDWHAAIAHADIVLSSRPTHCKALYRRALARFELNDAESHELGYQDLKRVLQLDPGNKEAARRLAEYGETRKSLSYRGDGASSSGRSGLDVAMHGILVDPGEKAPAKSSYMRCCTSASSEDDYSIFVLLGNLSGVPPGHPVLDSTLNDFVFLNIIAHGTATWMEFPDDGQLTKKRLRRILEQAKSRGKFKRMVVYVEACESGGMFEGLNEIPGM